MEATNTSWALALAVIGGLVATLLWTAVAYPVYVRVSGWRRFRHLAGTYRVDRKLEDETLCDSLRVRISGNVLTASSDEYDGSRYDARIALSEELAENGRGQYTNLACVGGELKRLWGFIEVQLVSEDDTILVHQWYVSQKKTDTVGKVIPRREVHSAYVWHRVG